MKIENFAFVFFGFNGQMVGVIRCLEEANFLGPVVRSCIQEEVLQVYKLEGPNFFPECQRF